MMGWGLELGLLSDYIDIVCVPCLESDTGWDNV